MLYTPVRGTLFYRVTKPKMTWPDVLSGEGSYFSSGGRYNRSHQRTVYAAVDPLVALTEAAFHQAVEWQLGIGRGLLSLALPLSSPNPPFVSDHLLWCFTLRNPPQLIDVEDPAARGHFHHRLYELLNRSQAYRTTADLADVIRQYPDPAHPTAEGILAPSVRTPASRGYIPRQHILFVPSGRTDIPGTLVKRWRLAFEFRDEAGRSVKPHTRVIDWSKAWFRLSRSKTAIPAYPHRPRARPFPPGTWHEITVR